jgi:hypothetical protein
MVRYWVVLLDVSLAGESKEAISLIVEATRPSTALSRAMLAIDRTRKLPRLAGHLARHIATIDLYRIDIVHFAQVLKTEPLAKHVWLYGHDDLDEVIP